MKRSAVGLFRGSGARQHGFWAFFTLTAVTAAWPACSSSGHDMAAAAGSRTVSEPQGGAPIGVSGGARSEAEGGGSADERAGAGAEPLPTGGATVNEGGGTAEAGAPATTEPRGGTAGTSSGGGGSGGANAGGGGSGGSSMIGNGDFQNGGQGWNVMTTGGPATIKTDGGKLCVEAGEKATQIVIGWPYEPYAPITLEPGISYTFSLRAVGTRTLQLIAKLGEVTSPYTPYSALIVETSGSWQAFSQSFSLNSGSQTVGVAVSFTLSALDAVCIDDVSVTRP